MSFSKLEIFLLLKQLSLFLILNCIVVMFYDVLSVLYVNICVCCMRATSKNSCIAKCSYPFKIMYINKTELYSH